MEIYLKKVYKHDTLHWPLYTITQVKHEHFGCPSQLHSVAVMSCIQKSQRAECGDAHHCGW